MNVMMTCSNKTNRGIVLFCVETYFFKIRSNQLFSFRYTEQDAMVDLVFPPVGKDGFDPEFKIQEFSSFGFWRESFQEIHPESLDAFFGKNSDKK